jgi:hypothetical protein
MSSATKTNTTPTAAPAPPNEETEADRLWTIGDVEPLLHDLEAEIGILGHVAASRNPIDPGQLTLLEDHLIDLQKRLMILWDKAWDEHLAFRHGARPPVAPDAVWDLLRSTAKVVLDQCDHPARIPSAPAASDSTDAELIAFATDYAAANAEIRRLQTAEIGRAHV